MFTIYELLEDITKGKNNLDGLNISQIKNIFKKYEIVMNSSDKTAIINVNSDSIPSDEIDYNEYICLDDLNVDVLSEEMKHDIIVAYSNMANTLLKILNVNIITNDKKYPPYRYSNKDNSMKVKELTSVQVPYSKYVSQSAFYFFMIEQKKPDVALNKYILCKPGFSNNIVKRKNDLETEYNAKLTLISIKDIAMQSYEQLFHSKMRILYPHLIVKSLNDKNVKEVYKFNPILLTEYLEFNASNEKMFEYQIEVEKTKQEEEKTKQEEAKTKRAEITEKEKTKQKHMDMITSLNNNGCTVDEIKEIINLGMISNKKNE